MPLQILKRSSYRRKQESDANRRTKRDRPLLVREFAPRMESDRARGVGGAAIRPVGERAIVCAVESRTADGYIAGFESKYHYNYWRPVTAIRERGDSEWLSYLWTPPVPDYPSTQT